MFNEFDSRHRGLKEIVMDAFHIFMISWIAWENSQQTNELTNDLCFVSRNIY